MRPIGSISKQIDRRQPVLLPQLYWKLISDVSRQFLFLHQQNLFSVASTDITTDWRLTYYQKSTQMALKVTALIFKRTFIWKKRLSCLFKDYLIFYSCTFIQFVWMFYMLDISNKTISYFPQMLRKVNNYQISWISISAKGFILI